MTTIKAYTDPSGTVSVFEEEGLFLIDEFLQCFETHMADANTPNLLCDFTKGDFNKLNYNALLDVMNVSNKYLDKRGPNPKTALLVTKEGEELLLKLYTDIMISNSTTISYKFVSSKEEAYSWFEKNQ